MMSLPPGDDRLKATAKPEIMRHTLSARSKLYELIVQFRQNAAQVDDPKAKILFEFSAEMLAGMARSFRDLEDESSGQS